MKWYGREANNRYDPKMVKLFDRYKCEGWTVYWTVLDMIAEKLDANHYTFCLEEETQFISKFLELTIEKVDAIPLKRFVRSLSKWAIVFESMTNVSP